MHALLPSPCWCTAGAEVSLRMHPRDDSWRPELGRALLLARLAQARGRGPAAPLPEARVAERATEHAAADAPATAHAAAAALATGPAAATTVGAPSLTTVAAAAAAAAPSPARPPPLPPSDLENAANRAANAAAVLGCQRGKPSSHAPLPSPLRRAGAHRSGKRLRVPTDSPTAAPPDVQSLSHPRGGGGH